jgi:hypothetical protein
VDGRNVRSSRKCVRGAETSLAGEFGRGEASE